MLSLDAFVGEAACAAVKLSDDLYSYLSSHGFDEFTRETDIPIPLDAPTTFDAEFLLAFFLALEPVVGALRKSDARYACEVRLGRFTDAHHVL